MIRGSDLHGDTCGACAAVCERCADECDQHGRGSPHGGVRRDLPRLRPDLPGDGRGYLDAARQGVESQPPLGRETQTCPPAEAAQPGLDPGLGGLRRQPRRRHSLPGSQSEVKLLQRHGRADRALRRPPPGFRPRPSARSYAAHSRRFHCRSAPQSAVRRRTEADERRPPPVGAVVSRPASGQGSSWRPRSARSPPRRASRSPPETRPRTGPRPPGPPLPARSSGPAACGPRR